MNTVCTSDAQVSAKHNTLIPGPPYTQRFQIHNSHRHNTTPPSRPWSTLSIHSPPTPPTPPQPKHRYTSNTPPVPTGLVKLKPNLVIHSPPSPPTQPRTKRIHISNTRPTPHIRRTTPIHNTSAVLDTIPEPRVTPYAPHSPHLIYPPQQHCRQPHTITLSQQTHMQHKHSTRITVRATTSST